MASHTQIVIEFAILIFAVGGLAQTVYQLFFSKN